MKDFLSFVRTIAVHAARMTGVESSAVFTQATSIKFWGARQATPRAFADFEAVMVTALVGLGMTVRVERSRPTGPEVMVVRILLVEDSMRRAERQASLPIIRRSPDNPRQDEKVTQAQAQEALAVLSRFVSQHHH